MKAKKWLGGIRWGWLCLCAALAIIMFPLMFESLSFVSKTGSLYRKRMVVYYVPVVLLMLICLKKPNASKWRNPTLVRSLYFMLAVVLGMCAFQRISSETQVDPVQIMQWPYSLIVLSLTFVIFLLVWCFVWDVRKAAVAGYWLMAVLGYGYQCVSMFRGVAFRPMDVFNIGTALSVAGEYQYPLEALHMFWVTAGAILTALYGWIPSAVRPRSVRLHACKLVCVAVAGIWCAFLVTTPFLRDIGVETTSWEWGILRLNRKQGTLNTLMLETWLLTQQKQENYDPKQLQTVDPRLMEEGLSQGRSEKPNVVVVINEGLSDLTSLWRIPASEDPLAYLHSLTENTVYGNVYVSSYGGGTCNTEHSFLTGTAPRPEVIFSLFSTMTQNTPSLAWQLKAQGYSTIALHPHDPTNYQRHTVYPKLGMDRFVSIHDIENPKYLRTFVSDEECYDQLIRLYEENRDNGPLFLYNMTMQNHSSYRTGMMHGEITLTEGPKDGEMEEYLSCIKHTDDALKRLIAYFSEQPEPVMLLIFGDHQPALEMDAYEKREDLTALEESLTTQITPFVLWANYPIEGQYVDAISVNYLSALMMQAAGLPMTGYDEWLLDVAQQYPVVLLMGYADSEGRYYDWESQAQRPEMLITLDNIRYNRLEDAAHRLPALDAMLTKAATP